MTTANDFLVLMYLVYSNKDLPERLEYLKQLSVELLESVWPSNILVDYRLVDEFVKAGLLFLSSTDVVELSSREYFTPVYVVLEEAFQDLISENVEFDMNGNLVMVGDYDIENSISIINRLFTISTITDIHKFIALNYPIVTHLIAKQLSKPYNQVNVLKKPVNFTSLLLSGGYKNVLPDDVLKFAEAL